MATPVWPATAPPASTSRGLARLTALWALAEVGLGGALHALRLPVTGLVVGSTAIVLLVLLAEAARRADRSVRQALLGATAIVLGVKLAASPHSPVGAYVAVAFQGGLAALIVPSLGRAVGPVALGVIALAESAVQRVLIMTLLFGATFWAALDSFVTQVLRQVGALGLMAGETLEASRWLIGGYIGVHVVVGALAGGVAARLARRVFTMAAQPEVVALAQSARAQAQENLVTVAVPRPWYKRRALRHFGLAVLLMALYAFTSGVDADGATAAGLAVLRAAVLVTAWSVLIAPWAMRAIRHLARHRTTRTQQAVAQLPELAALARLAWAHTSKAGFRRPLAFAALVTAAALAEAVPEASPARAAEVA
ncbi:MAG: hypothetical protein AAF730_01335 [Bacteroidota bacterium]